ncbi:uncharacterized protein LOC132725229 [Ruditapes philippinarum]|uniref:uncharacterized protein LOC132725229 n=1 Tax=Ruditapes philippinarum TaxID=129788 RepID=UPI00295C2948|nr:uncharacterized protein LOC132725229 [Ruditapes philippinarum]
MEEFSNKLPGSDVDINMNIERVKSKKFNTENGKLIKEEKIQRSQGCIYNYIKDAEDELESNEVNKDAAVNNETEDGNTLAVNNETENTRLNKQDTDDISNKEKRNELSFNICTGDKEYSIEKLANNLTHHAFSKYNKNNNSLCDNNARNLLASVAPTYIMEMPRIQRRFKTIRYIPVTDTEHLYHEHPEKNVIVPSSSSYAYIRKKRNPPRKSGWLTYLVSWSCKLGAVGMLVIFGFCLFEKYKDKRLYT